MKNSDSRCAVGRFCYHTYDYRSNWTPDSPITITYNVDRTLPRSDWSKTMFYQSINIGKACFIVLRVYNLYHKANEEAWAVYYTVIKRLGSGHLRLNTKKCWKHSPATSVFYLFLALSNVCLALSQCNTRLILFYFLTKTEKACFIVSRVENLYQKAN